MSLKFKTELDDSGFAQGLRRMESGVNQTANVISTKMRNAMSATGKKEAGMGHGGHGGARGLGDAINAISGGSGAVSELSALQGALGVGAGVAGAAIIAGEAISKYRESVKEARAATDEATKSLAKYTDGMIAAGPETVTKGIEENNKLVEKLKGSRGIGSNLNSVFGGDVNKKSLQAQGYLMERNRRLGDEMNKTMEAQAMDASERNSRSERENKLLDNKRDKENEIAKIRDTVEPKLQGMAIQKVQAEADAREKMIDHQADANDRHLSLERQISDIRKSGLNVAEDSAKARLSAAQEDFKSALNPDERGSAESKVKDAEASLEDVKRSRIQDIVSYEIEQEDAYYKWKEEQERKAAGLRMQLSEAQAQKSLSASLKTASETLDNRQTITDLRVKDRADALGRSKMSAHDRHAADRAAARAMRAEMRFDATHPEFRGNIERARQREQEARKAEKKIEAIIAEASIEKLKAALELVVLK